MKQNSKKTDSSHNSSTKLGFKQQLGAFKNLPDFFRLIWRCDHWLTIFNIVLRVIRASIPLAMLYVGKLIIDEIVRITGLFNGAAIENLETSILLFFVILELGLAIFSDLLGRGIAMVDSLLGDLVSHDISLRLMNQSARLDLESFEDGWIYNSLN